MLKEQKGITLVALIITIIVMLILAGVSISLVVGEQGVLTQAQKAGNATNEGAAKQAIELAFANLGMEYYGETTSNKGETVFTAAKFKKAIANAGNYDEAKITVPGDKLAAGTIEVDVEGIKFDVTIVEATTGSGTIKYPLTATKVVKK